MTTDPVVTVADTRGHGHVVRWFHNVGDATRPGSALLTASQRGVTVTGYLTDIPAGWVEAAVRAHKTLAVQPRTDMTGLATHRPQPPPTGPLVAVDPLNRKG